MKEESANQGGHSVPPRLAEHAVNEFDELQAATQKWLAGESQSAVNYEGPYLRLKSCCKLGIRPDSFSQSHFSGKSSG